MELNFSWFFTAVRVNILNFYYLGSVLYNFNKSVNLIYFDEINDLLLEELSDSFVNFSLEFRVFNEQSFQLTGEQVQ